jgi:hypothetical protein
VLGYGPWRCKGWRKEWGIEERWEKTGLVGTCSMRWEVGKNPGLYGQIGFPLAMTEQPDEISVI